MGRGATKAVANVWYKARIEAAKWNEKLGSRAGAAEEIGVSEDAIKNTELGLEKCMPVDKAVLLADLYRAPQLLNHYCLHQCPIGVDASVSDSIGSLENITLKMIRMLNLEKIKQIKSDILDIGVDGEENADIDKLEDISVYMSEMMVVASELKSYVKRRRLNG